MASRRSHEPEKADKRKQRALNSCLPCRQRKVKCDQERPCSNCVKRNSVSECISTPARANEMHVATPHTSTTVTSPSDSENVSISRRTSSLQIASPTSRVHEDIIRPTIENGASEKPSMLYDDDPEGTKTFEMSRADIMELWQTYRNRIQLLAPMLLDPDEVEGWMVKLTLPTHDNQVPGSDKIRLEQLADYLPELSHSSRSLLLSVLAAAAQFASKTHLRTQQVLRSLLTLSFRTIRRANYLRNPTIDLIQAFILIGNVLQNDRASQAAWCLLGTTIRLAECVGAHQGLWPGMQSGPDLARDARSQLMYRIAWQDGLLSMSLGRNPSVWLRGVPHPMPGKPINYAEAMILLNARLGTSLWALQSRHQDDFEALLHQAQANQEYIAQLAKKLALSPVSFNSQCLSTAFAMHSAFTLSYLCRPALKYHSLKPDQESNRMQILELCKTNLVAALKHYVYLTGAWEFTIRSWSVAHSGLGAALMLGTLGEFKEDKIRQLAATVIESLESRLEDVSIVSKGSKALDLLKSLYDEATGALRHDPRPPTLRVSAIDGRLSTPSRSIQSADTKSGGQDQAAQQQVEQQYGRITDEQSQQQVPMPGPYEAPFLYSFAEPAALEEFDSLFTDVAPFAWDAWDDLAY